MRCWCAAYTDSLRRRSHQPGSGAFVSKGPTRLSVALSTLNSSLPKRAWSRRCPVLATWVALVGLAIAAACTASPSGNHDACGAGTQACCQGTACNDGFSCVSGSCEPSDTTCGTADQVCCNGTACNSSLLCKAGRCVAAPVPVCGGVMESCCGATACDTGLVCTGGVCLERSVVACGGSYQGCCEGTACNKGLECSGGTCQLPPTCDLRCDSRMCTGGVCWKVVFAIGGSYPASGIGGVAGGDAKCQDAAVSAGLKGTYRAWLSDDEGRSPASRFTRSSVPYVLINGTIIASNWQSLISGSIAEAITLTERALPVPTLESNYDKLFFTGTNNNGLPATGRTCGGWKNSYGSVAVGSSAWNFYSGKYDFWTDGGGAGYTATCADAASFYCFEQ
jgi:hypothetical protein